MKVVALSGAHGTGKTTLCRKLEEKLTDSCKVSLCRAVPRVIIDEVKDRDFFRRGNNTPLRQFLIFIYKLWEEREKAVGADILICDRTVVDHLAYAIRLFPELMGSREMFAIEALAQNWIRAYDYVFKLPIEFPLQDDGVREADIEFQAEINQTIDQLYARFELIPTVVGGSLEDRVSAILTRIA